MERELADLLALIRRLESDSSAATRYDEQKWSSLLESAELKQARRVTCLTKNGQRIDTESYRRLGGFSGVEYEIVKQEETGG
jgi:hypothetical protein